jgi:dUTP pyrophosphatase
MPAMRVVRVDDASDLPLPAYASEGAAGVDLYAAVPVDKPVRLLPGQRAGVRTGVCVMIPPGFEGQVRARSGRALREGLAMLNAPGTIDADFRGEILVLAVNLGQAEVVIRRGERIAQLVIAPVARVDIEEVAAEGLEPTSRGDRGFGSTGR